MVRPADSTRILVPINEAAFFQLRERSEWFHTLHPPGSPPARSARNTDRTATSGKASGCTTVPGYQCVQKQHALNGDASKYRGVGSLFIQAEVPRAWRRLRRNVPSHRQQASELFHSYSLAVVPALAAVGHDNGSTPRRPSCVCRNAYCYTELAELVANLLSSLCCHVGCKHRK